MRSWCAFIVLAGLWACRPVYEGTATPPSDIVAVGVLSEGQGSLLEAWPAGAPMPIVTEGAGPHFVVGFTAEQLAPFGQGWQNGTLRTAAACEATLPPPAWVGRIDGPTLSAVQGGFEGELTVDGLRDVCPSKEALPLILDVRGETDRCAHRILRTGCEVDVITECGPGDFSGWVHPDGGYCLQRTREDWTCSQGQLQSGAALQCSSGTREVELVQASEGAAPFDIQTLSLGPGDLFEPRLWQLSRQLYAADMRVGYVHGMVALSDRVLVSHTMGGEGGDCWSDEDQPTMLTVIDSDQVEVISQVLAPRCTVELTADEGGQSFVGFVVLPDENYALARFDANGTMVESQVIARSNRWGRAPQGLRFIEAEDRLQFFLPPSSSLPGLELRVHQRSDLSHVETATISGVPRLIAMSWLDDDNAIIVESIDTFLQVDVAQGSIVGSGSYLEGQIYPGRFVSGYAPNPQELALTMNGPNDSTLYHWRAGDRAQIRLPLQPDVALSNVIGWPDGRWLVSGIDAGDPDKGTAFSLYDPVQDRFQAGVWRASSGIASMPVWDAQGRLWVAHPWANEISRLVPR